MMVISTTTSATGSNMNCIENSNAFIEWEYHEIRRETALKIGFEIGHGPFGTTLKHLETNSFIENIETRRDAYDYLKQFLKDNPLLLEKL